MRAVSYILVAVLAVSVLGPGALCTIAPCAEADELLGTLDVCHRSAPAISAGGEMPCMHSCPCQPVPLPSVRIGIHRSPLFSEFNVCSLHEKPPEVLQ